MEHRFNEFMIEDLRKLGVRAPLATTDAWGNPSQFNLPSLTDGDIIDVHSYGDAESLSANPRYEPNFISWIGAAQVQDKPLSITEWNTPLSHSRPVHLAAVRGQYRVVAGLGYADGFWLLPDPVGGTWKGGLAA